MSKEIAVKTASGLVIHTKSKLMGVASNLSSQDVAIPSLMLMQSNSTFAQESDDINSGDFLHSTTREVWGKKNTKPIELVFFFMFKTQIVSDVSVTKAWLATNQWTEEMELAPYEIEEDGKLIRREKCFNYVCFKADEAREVMNPITGELTATASPIVVKFKGGSMKNGKRLNQVFEDYCSFGAPSWATTFFLSADFEENDKGKYWVYNFKRGEQTAPLQQMAAEARCKQFTEMKSAVKVSDEESIETAPEDIVVEPRNVTQAPTPTKKKKVKNHAPGATNNIV